MSGRAGGDEAGKLASRALWAPEALLPTGWARGVRVTLDGPRIAAVETGAAPAGGDDRCGPLLPGLPNVHSHAFQRAMAGLAERRGPAGDSFWTWREVMYHFLARLTPDDVEAIAAQAYAEMLESGFTRVGEFHYLHHDPEGRPYADIAELAARIAAAADATGIALTLLPSFYAHGGIGGLPPVAGQRRFLTDLDTFARLVTRCRALAADLEGATVGVAPHSLRAVTPDELRAVLPLAAGGPVHIHAAEQRREVADCVAWSGQAPVAWLLEQMPVDARWCLIHATHTTDAERRALAAAGAVAGLCPLTEQSLGDGIFGGAVFLAAGGRFGIGSDSNILVDAAAELRALETSQRLATESRNVLALAEGESTGRRLIDSALAGGAQALGAPPAVIAPGAPADLVALDAAHPALAGRTGDGVLDAWIFAGRAPVVDRVWRAGRCVVRGGRHVHAAAIAARYRAVVARLLEERGGG